MWNPFASSADEMDRTARQPEGAPLPPDGERVMKAAHASRTGIAEIEMMGDVAIATLTVTELSQEAGAEALALLLVELAETGAHHFVLDVEIVQYMDSACLGCLVEALNKLAVRGGKIALANSNHSVHYIFRLTRLDRVFMICSDVMSAIQAVEKAAKSA